MANTIFLVVDETDDPQAKMYLTAACFSCALITQDENWSPGCL